MFVIGAHQPLAEFHTGLLAKVWALHRFDGDKIYKIWVVHDLDSMTEEGSMSIHVPSKNSLTSIPLYSQVNRKRHMLFTSEAEYLGVRRVAEVVISWLQPSSKDVKEIRGRAEALDEKFPPQSVVVAVRNTEMMLFLLEHIGVPKPDHVLYLSELLLQEKEKLKTLLGQFGIENFWEWDKEGNTRKPVTSTDLLELLIEEGRLIPKAIPLIALLRMMTGESGFLIRGMGQAEYEKKFPYLPRVRRAPIVTSFQAFQLGGVGLRPSAVLMYLLGVKFDPHCVLWK
jgi:hypothetical protein